MPYFDRFDICEAYLALEHDWNVGGVLQERPAARKPRRMSVCYQLHRMGFHPGYLFEGYASLTENGQAIYNAFCEKHRMCSGCDGSCFDKGLSCDAQSAAHPECLGHEDVGDPLGRLTYCNGECNEEKA